MKSELLELIRAELRARLDRLAKAAMDAHAAATDPGSKAESKYDTRSLEESYLATGQAIPWMHRLSKCAGFPKIA